MSLEQGLLAVIPARGGSKGLAGKNVKLLAGIPLIGHSILLARTCREIDRVVVSTDSPEIAAVARSFGADVLDRPGDLARDDSPMWPVITHALATVEQHERRRFAYVLLLDPTSPGRTADDIVGALQRLGQVAEADGIIGVSRPDFNPIWHCVVERDGWMTDLVPEAVLYNRRQDVPPVYRINASLYLWRAAFVRREPESWRTQGRHLIYEIPEGRAVHIDDPQGFARAEDMLRAGLLDFPWLSSARGLELRKR